MEEKKKVEREDFEAENKVPSKLTGGKIFVLFLIGFLIGAVIKTQASGSITMGFDDYKLDSLQSDFNLVQTPATQTEGKEGSEVESNQVEDSSDESEEDEGSAVEQVQ